MNGAIRWGMLCIAGWGMAYMTYFILFVRDYSRLDTLLHWFILAVGALILGWRWLAYRAKSGGD